MKKTLTQEERWEMEAFLLQFGQIPFSELEYEERAKVVEYRRSLDYDTRMRAFIAKGFHLVIGGKSDKEEAA